MTPILQIFYSLSYTLEKFAEINGLKIKVGRKPIKHTSLYSLLSYIQKI